jgi:hypothetical protein
MYIYIVFFVHINNLIDDCNLVADSTMGSESEIFLLPSTVMKVGLSERAHFVLHMSLISWLNLGSFPFVFGGNDLQVDLGLFCTPITQIYAAKIVIFQLPLQSDTKELHT